MLEDKEVAALRSKLRDEGAHNLLHRVSCQVLYPTSLNQIP